MEKSQLRKEFFRELKKHQDPFERQIVLSGIQRNIKKFFRHKKIKKILAYKPLPSELPVLNFLGELDVEIYIPSIKEEALIPVSLIRGKYEKLFNMDYIIVPGLFVNNQGYRLGRGGGFYDRLLQYYPRYNTVFVCQSWQVLNNIPVEPWDKRIGFILNEKKIEFCL